MKKIKNIINNPIMPILFLIEKMGLIRFTDEYYIKNFYKFKFGKKLNLNNPITFNEKLQWLKLNNRKDIYTKMVDKYDAKAIIEEKIGIDYVIPTLGIFESFDEIDFSKLPKKFVIKCTHDSGGLEIVKDKENLDINKLKKKINKSLKRNFYFYGREWPYKNVKPRILIEKYMEDKKTAELRDYKFFCFNGEVKCFKIDFNRSTFHQANYYDKNGKILNFGEEVCPPDYNKILELPKNMNEMIKFAELLSHEIPFLRVDFYETNGKIYFGELTFYPASGFGKFVPEEWDVKLGEYLKI